MKLWKTIGNFVYGLVGLTALASLIWAIIEMSRRLFFITMGFFGSVGFFVLVVGGLNWLIKLLFKKDLFGN